MALKWKTTITYPNWTPPPPSARQEILDQCQQLQDQGKYTGGFENQPVPGQPGAIFVHRWWWVDEPTASQYVEFVELAWPGQQKTISITSEEVPD